MEINERLAKLEADEKNIFHQLSEIKEEVRDIHRLTNAVEKIAVRTESIECKVDQMGSRISALEKSPADNFSHYKKVIAGAVITAVISALTAAVFALILKV